MKKVLILTLNNYILYQPTILNLYDSLSGEFDVEVLSFCDRNKQPKIEGGRKISFLSTGFWGSQFYSKLDFLVSKMTSLIRKIKPGYTYYYRYYNNYLPGILERFLRSPKKNADIVIAVDLQVLLLAQKIYGEVHFLSLEVDNNTNPLYKRIEYNKIKSVFIQSKARYEYIFPGQNIPVFYVQNAPVFSGRQYPIEGRSSFIWSGAIDKRLAILDVLSFFRRYPTYKMVLKGSANPKLLRFIEIEYADLIQQGVLEFNRTYLASEMFIEFLSGFKIGFCFYEWDLIRSSFNYLTAPSGKLFMNFAAGVPVIACNIPGFELVRDFGAGELIDDYRPETILAAMEKIESDYQNYSEGCYRAAEFFSFDKNVAAYVQYLKTTVK